MIYSASEMKNLHYTVLSKEITFLNLRRRYLWRGRNTDLEVINKITEEIRMLEIEFKNIGDEISFINVGRANKRSI